MFCAFEGPPGIVRVDGGATPLLPGDERFDELLHRFPSSPGLRSIVLVDGEYVTRSCGFGVPILRYERDRDDLITWFRRRGPAAISAFQARNNTISLDGLPGIPESVPSDDAVAERFGTHHA